MNALTPFPVEIVENRQEAHNIFTLRVRPPAGSDFRFRPGQFNMLYVFGAGEIPISIASDPNETGFLDHTVRSVGDLSRSLTQTQPGDYIGIRGPFGSSWPVDDAVGQDVVVITGGLGCAPTLSVVEYVLKRRNDYGQIHIFHGAKLPRDVIFRQRFDVWRRAPDTHVHLTVDRPEGQDWPYGIGLVTHLIEQARIDVSRSIVMMCGPEIMMQKTAGMLVRIGVPEERVYVSMERNMKCAVGLCGHCQFGAEFICREGPVFPYSRIRRLLEVEEL